MIDYYKVLNVPSDASLEALREQYRFLLNAFHPDKFSSSGQEKNLAKAEEKTKEINAAYEVLKNPASRSEYDRKRAAEKERLRAASAPPPEPPRTAQTPPPAAARPAAKPAATRPAAKSNSSPLDDEELIGHCLQIMRETGKASASLFQRRLRLSYTQTSHLIDLLESHGVIGPERGARGREILVDLGPRVTPRPAPAPVPAPIPTPPPAQKNFEEERRRLLAEQQRLEAQLRMQRVAAARPIVRRHRAPFTNFGCLQGCGCLILGVVGLMFLSALSRGCTRPADTPAAASTNFPAAPLPPTTPMNPSGGGTGQSPGVRCALPVGSSDPAASTQRVLPANTTAPGLYAVTGIAKNDALNVHSGPGSNYEVVAKLPNGYQGVQVFGASVMNGTTEWVQINFKNQSGWVTKAYLKAQ